MDQPKTHKHPFLPRTSRVNEKIIEYCTKFDRDLEKFMRLDSPNSNKSRSRSKKSRGSYPATPTPTNSSCGFSEDDTSCIALRRLFRLNNPECESISGSSKSLPSMDLCGKSENKEERIIPIVFKKDQTDISTENDENVSPEDLVTPIKSSNAQTKHTQTPDSVAKSHKRLEWDSLGDVGYKKSMSTSNISILERSLLREFFHESIGSKHSEKQTTNVSESDLKTLRKKLINSENHEYKSPDCKNSSSPLASSTWVEPKNLIPSTGTRPKYTTQGTSTSLLKKYEKFVQTSLPLGTDPAPSKQSREVQVNMSSATTSIVGSSATPSSFEYCCSSLSNTTSGNNGAAEEYQQSPSQPHPFVAGISEMLARRKALHENNNRSYKHKKSTADMEACNSVINILSESLTKALSENKENSGLENVKTPQLDLGIQLLCSLIDAKSLNRKEKKLLIRDIVKKITRLADNGDNGSMSSSLTSKRSTSSSVTVPTKLGDAHIITVARSKLSTAKNKIETPKSAMQQERGTTNSLEDESVVRVDVCSQSSPPTTSTKALEKQVVKTTTTKQSEKSDKNSKDAPLISKCSEIGKELLIDIHLSGDAETSTRPSSSSTPSATSTSKDLTTQKVAVEVNNSTDAEATMSEWLNPLTQSEIEYENKKLELAAKQKEKLLRRQKPDKERDAQLSWIEKEIERLESLKYLLLKEDSSDSSDVKNTTRNMPKIRKDLDSKKLYDTVYSDPEKQESSSVLSACAERMVQEIEVIIEESNEDVINLNKNIKRSRQRKKETEIIYDKPTKEGETNDLQLNGKARFRTMKEIVTTNEEQVLPILEEKGVKATQSEIVKEAPVPIHRSKMDTPSCSNDSESVCSFVQQRKREFMEHYKNKKKSHYEALLQQQHQEYEQQRPTTSAAAAQTTDHYSVPHTIQRSHPISNNFHNHPNYYHHHVQPHMHYHFVPRKEQRAPAPVPPPVPTHMNYSASAGLTSAQSNNNNTHSSSSMFCISSEVSIPMGSNATSSTTTTTHQYDDVAAGVGIQTSDSILRSHPIFGPRRDRKLIHDGMPGTTLDCKISAQSASIQVKPKSIAYVISFDKKTEAETSPSSSTSNVEATLQEYLQRAKPNFCAQSKERKAILNQIQALRQERERELRNIVENTSFNSLDRKLKKLPPAPTVHTRIFATKEMKAMTNKRYARLPEVLDRQKREREERRRRSNRILRDVFNWRLQKRVRNGKLSLNHSRTVI